MNKKQIQLLPSLSQLFFCKREKNLPPNPFSPKTPSYQNSPIHSVISFICLFPFPSLNATSRLLLSCPGRNAWIWTAVILEEGSLGNACRIQCNLQNGSGARRPVVHMNFWSHPSRLWLSNWDIIWKHANPYPGYTPTPSESEHSFL